MQASLQVTNVFEKTRNLRNSVAVVHLIDAGLCSIDELLDITEPANIEQPCTLLDSCRLGSANDE